MNAYRIVDPYPIQAANPRSFYVPCDERIAAIASGDFVKVMISDDSANVERMWVKVVTTRKDTLTGTLLNQPVNINGLEYGHYLTLRRVDVIDIQTERDDDPAETNIQDNTLFHRCLMDKRVYAGKAQPVRIVRDAPQPADYGVNHPQIYPWGGWRILAEGYDETMPTEVGTPIIAVRIDDSMVDLFAAPEGAAFDLVDGQWVQTA